VVSKQEQNKTVNPALPEEPEKGGTTAAEEGSQGFEK